MSDAKIISVINWKGGVGKTTLTHHLATGLQSLSLDKIQEYLGYRRYPRVLLLDTDAQCNLSISCLTDSNFELRAFNENNPLLTTKDIFNEFLFNSQPNYDIYDFILKKSVRRSNNGKYFFIDLIPSHPDLIYTDMSIATFSRKDFQNNLISSDMYKFEVLNKVLNDIKDQYDFIFIDCPPNLNYITQNALLASDYYLIPTIPDKLSSYGILSITNKVNELNKTFSLAARDYNETELIGIVANKVKEYSRRPINSQSNILSTLKKIFNDKVFESYLTEGNGIPSASALGYPVFAYEYSSQNSEKQSTLIKNILEELLTKIKG